MSEVVFIRGREGLFVRPAVERRFVFDGAGQPMASEKEGAEEREDRQNQLSHSFRHVSSFWITYRRIYIGVPEGGRFPTAELWQYVPGSAGNPRHTRESLPHLIRGDRRAAADAVPPPAAAGVLRDDQIGRASCRERV